MKTIIRRTCNKLICRNIAFYKQVYIGFFTLLVSGIGSKKHYPDKQMPIFIHQTKYPVFDIFS